MKSDLFIDGQNNPGTQARKAVDPMKTLIVFGTKSGTTEKCAHKIQSAMASAEADVVDIRKLKNGDLAAYDTVVLGTSVYMGRINGKLRRFLTQNAQALMGKKLHLFVCSLAQGEEGVAELHKQISDDLFRHAIQVTHLGCEANYERLNPFYRSIMKKIVAEQKPAMGLHEQEIEAFAQKVVAA